MNFCTIFDSNYFAKGLALYHSLLKVCNFHLYVFTPDQNCINLLAAKNLSNITITDFKEIENEQLLRVKTNRSLAEYFWTIKGSCLEFLFHKFNLDTITYVDADTYFYSSPNPIFNEFEKSSVLIIPHNFSSKYLKEKKNGLFNAGFISFRNDKLGLVALNWWKERSIEWCYRKKVKDKFGDQLYLNTLSKFGGVHILNHRGTLANWNVQQYKFEMINDSIFGISSGNEKFKVVFYHFHYLKFLDSCEVELGRKYISEEVVNLFYKPYIKYLLELAPYDLQGAEKKTVSWKTPILFVKRKVEKTYNIFPVQSLIEL